jgi:hypothetical protein
LRSSSPKITGLVRTLPKPLRLLPPPPPPTPRRNQPLPLLYAAVSLWVFGMLLMTVMPSPVTVTSEMEAEFDDLMSVSMQAIYGPLPNSPFLALQVTNLSVLSRRSKRT